MTVSYEQAIVVRDALKDEYMDRHDAQRRLRKFWHGRYWENTESDKGGLASIFRDLTSRQSDVGPDIKLVYNVLKDVCVKFQTYLAPLPMIRCYVDPPSSPTRRNQATLRERYLYGMWAANNMNKVLADQGWYLPLMGDVFLGAYPDLDKNMIRTLLRSPEHAFPMMNYDSSSEDGVIFSWKAKQSAIRRSFPQWNPEAKQDGRAFFSMSRGTRRPRPSDPEVEIVEWSDKDCFYRWIGGVQVAGVEHNKNYDLFEHVKFINVPGEVWGHGAVEQAVNLVEMGNAYLSLMMQSAIENVFPVMVIEDPMSAPETLERGAGAVIPVNKGGKVTYLVPPSGTMLAQGEFMHNVERMVQQNTSMPEVNFGQAHQSIVTGKAINQLQGAGTGTLVEMVQGVGIGCALTKWNEKCLDMGRTMFAEDTIRLFGVETGSIADLNPRHFSINIKGSQLVGSTRNEVVFMPYLDMQQKVVIGLQLAGAGLVSRQWQRENVGIPDSEAMDEEIVSETIQDAVLQLLVQSIVDPESADQAETAADDVIEGGHLPHPLTQMQPPSLPPGTPGAPPQAGAPALPPAPQPGPPSPNAAPTPPAHGSAAQGVILDQAIQAFQSLQVQGRVFLVGEIVQTGQTADPVNVDITSDADRDVVSKVPFPVIVKVVAAEPSEPYIEVTPGADTAMKGELPHPDEALG